MANKFFITVHPAPLSGDFLTVSDAMNQVLDLIGALDRSESTKQNERKIVWRLMEAHTNSPPFTVVAESFSIRPDLSVALESTRVTNLFQKQLSALMDGEKSDLCSPELAPLIKRILERNLNGIGQTEVRFDDSDSINLVPQSARVALRSIERANLDADEEKPDWQRTEYGTVEVEIVGLTRWNSRPALDVTDRLSERKFRCVLSEELSSTMGPAHMWNEVWEGRFVEAHGALHYNSEGHLVRADVTAIEPIKWENVTDSDMLDIDLIGESSMEELLASIRGRD